MPTVALSDASPSPPPGWVDRETATRMFGVKARTWEMWDIAGKLDCGRWMEWSGGAGGRRRRIYPLDAIEAMVGDLRTLPPRGKIGREEAAKLLGVSLATFKRWHSEGLFRGVRSGRHVFFDLAQLKAFVAQEREQRWPPYPDPGRSGSYRVPLSCHGSPHPVEAIIDAESLPLMEGRRWVYSPPAKGGAGRVLLAERGALVILVRIIMGVTDPAVQVGHVNGDPLDCRAENLITKSVSRCVLRHRTPTSRKREGRSSRFKGVYWLARNKKWRAKITSEGKAWSLGCFDEEIAAARAYDEAARKLFGEHAWLNFPNGTPLPPLMRA